MKTKPSIVLDRTQESVPKSVDGNTALFSKRSWVHLPPKGIYNRLPLIMSYLLDIDLAL